MSAITDLDIYPSIGTQSPGKWTTPWSDTVTNTVTNTTPLHRYTISSAEKIIEASVLSLICAVAFSGNVLLWCVIIRNKTLRTPSNALVLCLSSADILVSVVNMPITILTILHGEQFFDDELCVVLGFANMTFFIASVMSLAAISLNRYVLIVHPNRFKMVYTIRNTALVILVVWVLSMVLASPPLFGWARYDYLRGQSFCFCYWKDSISYTFFMVIVCFGGPCSVMSFCYYNILQEVRRSRKRLSCGPGRDASSMNSAQSALSAISKNSSVSSGRGDMVVKGSGVAKESGVPNENGVPNGKGVPSGKGGPIQSGNLNGGFIAGVNDSLETIKKSRMTSLHEAFTRQLSKRRVRVEPSSPENCLPGLVPDGKRPRSLPTRIKSIQTAVEPCSPKKNASPSRTVSRYQSQNQEASTSKPPMIRIKEFNRSVSLNLRRGSNTSLIRELHGESEKGVMKTTKSSPKRQGNVPRQLSGSTLVVPGLKAAIGMRRKRSKTAREMRRKQEELKLTKSFLVVILVFIICWFPFCITMFWSVFSPYPVYRPADMASLLLGFFNSCCNPIIYGVMNTRFRAGFKHILCCHWTLCYRSRPGKSFPDRGFGSVTGTAAAGYHDDISCTAD